MREALFRFISRLVCRWPAAVLLSALGLAAVGVALASRLEMHTSRIDLLSPESRAYVAFIKKLRRRGGEVGPSSTTAEVLAEAGHLAKLGNKEALAELIGIYERARFGGLELDAGQRQRLRRLASAIK